MHTYNTENRDPDPRDEVATPTAPSPDSVPESVPEAAEHVGKTGPNASDPPRAGTETHGARTMGESVGGDSGAEGDTDPELDADEGADAFETREEASDNARENGPDRRDEEIVNLDTPD